jgi:hypothetical protein
MSDWNYSFDCFSSRRISVASTVISTHTLWQSIIRIFCARTNFHIQCTCSTWRCACARIFACVQHATFSVRTNFRIRAARQYLFASAREFLHTCSTPNLVCARANFRERAVPKFFSCAREFSQACSAQMCSARARQHQHFTYSMRKLSTSVA